MTIWIKSSSNLLPFSPTLTKCLFFPPLFITFCTTHPPGLTMGLIIFLKTSGLKAVLSLQCYQPWPNTPRHERGRGWGKTNRGVWNESGFVQGGADRFPFKHVSLRIWQVVPMATVAHLRIVCASVLVHISLYVCASRDLLAWHL